MQKEQSNPEKKLVESQDTEDKNPTALKDKTHKKAQDFLKKHLKFLEKYSPEDKIFLISGAALLLSIMLGSMGLIIVSVIALGFIFDVLSGHALRKKIR